MNKITNETLAKLIAVGAIILYLIFVFSVMPSQQEIQGLEGGNIQHAIDTKQIN